MWKRQYDACHDTFKNCQNVPVGKTLTSDENNMNHLSTVWKNRLRITF